MPRLTSEEAREADELPREARARRPRAARTPPGPDAPASDETTSPSASPSPSAGSPPPPPRRAEPETKRRKRRAPAEPSPPSEAEVADRLRPQIVGAMLLVSAASGVPATSEEIELLTASMVPLVLKYGELPCEIVALATASVVLIPHAVATAERIRRRRAEAQASAEREAGPVRDTPAEVR